MAKSRIALALWVCGLILYYIVSEDAYLPFLLLILTAALTASLGISVLLLRRKLYFQIFGEGEYETDSAVSVLMEGENRSFLPLARGNFLLRLHNIYTGTELDTRVGIALKSRGRERMKLEFESRYCGAVEIRLENPRIYDILGIFSAKCDLYGESVVSVLPEAFPSYVDVTTRAAANRDSDYYSDSKRGYDSSETFGIRQYVPGDNVKFIHWKLSSKLDDIVIRELGFPIQNSILLIAETSWREKEYLPQEKDAVASALYSLSHGLCEEQMPHFVAWYDFRASQLAEMEITAGEDVHEMILRFIAIGSQRDETTALEHYLEERRNCDFAHIVYLTAEPEQDLLEQMSASASITVLKVTSEEQELGQDDFTSGISVVSFSREGIQEDLEEVYI